MALKGHDVYYIERGGKSGLLMPSLSPMWVPMHSTAKLSLQCTCLGFTQVCPSAAEGVEEKYSYSGRKQLVSLTNSYAMQIANIL